MVASGFSAAGLKVLTGGLMVACFSAAGLKVLMGSGDGLVVASGFCAELKIGG